jgi:hypothetical protein
LAPKWALRNVETETDRNIMGVTVSYKMHVFLIVGVRNSCAIHKSILNVHFGHRYNDGQNALVVAEHFVAREGMRKDHLEQITAFIRQNTGQGSGANVREVMCI